MSLPLYRVLLNAFARARRETTISAALAPTTTSMGNAHGQDVDANDDIDDAEGAEIGNACGSLPVPGIPGIPVICAWMNCSIPVELLPLGGLIAKILVTVQGFNWARTGVIVSCCVAITLNV